MIKISKSNVFGWEEAIRGMRNSWNSWSNSDSKFYHGRNYFEIGPNDQKLMLKLAKLGGPHAKYRRMITVSADILAPRYWWAEYDTYKVGTVANSCSTMHTIASKKFERKDFSIEHLKDCDELYWMTLIDNLLSSLNMARKKFLETNDKAYWWYMIQLLPASYNQLRTVTLNYEVLANIYQSRHNHKLDEWRDFCKWIETMPYSELITLKDKEN